jgi:hypothetical protein
MGAVPVAEVRFKSSLDFRNILIKLRKFFPAIFHQRLIAILKRSDNKNVFALISCGAVLTKTESKTSVINFYAKYA